MTTSATFDGTGGTYLEVACPAAAKTYPFWVNVWVRWTQRPTFGTVYCPWSAERADGSHGQCFAVYQRKVRAQTAAASSFNTNWGPQALIPHPYWESVLCEFRSATDRRIYINGTLEETNTTNLTADLSTGSPVLRVGIRASGIQPWHGQLADLAIGTGTPSDSDRTTLSTPGATITGVTGIAHHYPLISDGNDVIGTAHLTPSGTISYTTGRPATRSAPSAADVRNWILKQSTVRSESPSVTTGQTSPIAGMSNVSDVEHIDASFTGSAGAWNTRMIHWVPTSQVSPTHLVIVDNGHAFSSEWASYNTDDVVTQLVAAGFGVLLYQMPGFSPQDPMYTGSTPDHNTLWASFSDSVNPAERFVGCQQIALNNLAGRYVNISICGISGGGWAAPWVAAMDTRINHSVIPIRGTIAHRRYRLAGDFEQEPAPTGYKAEEAYRLCISNGQRLWLTHHANDPVIGAINDADNAGAYISASSYYTNFLAPIIADNPNGDIQFIEDGGAAPHVFTQWAIDNAIIAAVKRGKTITARGGASGLPVFGS